MGSSKWMKVKMALGLKLNSCLYLPSNDGDGDSPPPLRSSDLTVRMPTTPTPSSSGLILPKQSLKSNKNTCAICLGTMKAGHGHAIFTAECSHAFHFHCISSNVKHGRQTCPVCRSKWKEIPLQDPNFGNKTHKRSTNTNNNSSPREESWGNVVRRLPSPRINVARNRLPSFAEPSVFNDDDEVNSNEAEGAGIVINSSSSMERNNNRIEVKVYPEIPEAPKSTAHENFSILVHLKAPVTSPRQHSKVNEAAATSQSSRAPVDLVTVLDVSGSMAGTKLALLKQAMGFVIQNLGPMDRLSLIAFSSSARRLFPLRKMTESGKREALEAVSSLSANGGTNIAEGLKKGAKLFIDRRWKNSVSSIILLSDGQDTYTMNSPRGDAQRNDYKSLLPIPMHRDSVSSIHIAVHTFGFGADHDAMSMHAISEFSGGTFSFIENEVIIQDAFAQCIGGLLSVVVQELKVELECIDPEIRLVSVESGSYKTSLSSDRRNACIDVGDLYAEEERDFLITVDIPMIKTECSSKNETSLLNVRCHYRDPVSKNLVTLDPARDALKIQRPIEKRQVEVSMEVDRQRNRVNSAEAMSRAKSFAERGDLNSAVRVLESCREHLSETVSAKAGDRLCVSLDAELCEMQERMADRQVYETSGRAYVLSGLSSHSWQRATARGDSTESTSLVHAYQTPSMDDMVNLSQTMVFRRPVVRSSRSPQARANPSR